MLTLEQAITQYGQCENFCKYQGLIVSLEELNQITAWLRELQERQKADSCDGCVREFGKTYLLVCASCKRRYADLYEPERKTDEAKRSD